MKEFQNMIHSLLQKRRHSRRTAVVMAVLSLLLLAVIFCISVMPGISATRLGLGSDTPVISGVKLLGAEPGGTETTYFSSVQNTPLGDDLGTDNKLQSISISYGGQTYSGSQVTINAGSDSTLDLDLTLNYMYTNSQLRSSDIFETHCIYYQVPEGTVNIPQDYFGPERIVLDTDWSDEYPSGYFSVSQSGLIVIRFTDDYINYLQNSNDGFAGKILFRCYVDRNDGVDGDHSFTLAGQQVNVKFDDEELAMTKTNHTGRDTNGKYIDWTITIANPNGDFNLNDYHIEDTITENNEAVDWSRIELVSVDPVGAAVKSDDGFSLSGNAEQVTITYRERAESGRSYRNTADLKYGDTPVDSKDSEVTIENKLGVKKTGTADYQIAGRGEHGQIQWEINVWNQSGDSLQLTDITDSNGFPDGTKLYDINGNELDSSLYEIDSENPCVIRLKDDPSIPSRVTVVYETDVSGSYDSTGTAEISNEVTVSSEKQPEEEPPDPATSGDTVYYHHQYSMEKTCSVFNTQEDMLQWKIKVWATQNGANNNSSATLNGYVISDEAIINKIYDNNQVNGQYLSFNAFRNGETVNITDMVRLIKDEGSNTVTIRLEEGVEDIPISCVEIFYQQPIEENLSDSAMQEYLNGGQATVSNTASGQMPGTDMGEQSTGTRTEQKRIESSKVYLSAHNEKVIGNSDKEDRTLEWKIVVTNDSGFDDTARITDTLSDSGGGSHYIKPSQAADFRLYGKATDQGSEELIPASCYTITFYDENDNVITDFANGSTNAVKYAISFKEAISHPTRRYISVSYQTTAEVRDVINGDTAHFDNTMQFGDQTPKSVHGLTFEREDPNNVKNMTIRVQKNWDDNNNKFHTRPDNYTVRIWRAKADENGGSPAADAEDVWELVGTSQISSAHGSSELGEFPQWIVENVDGQEVISRYCYKITEVIDDESGYRVSQISAPVVARYDSTTMNLTNKFDQDLMKFPVDRSGTEIEEVDLSAVPKAMLTVNGSETECYIFGWKIYFKEGEKLYTDTLPAGAIYITGSENGMDKYKPKAIYDDYGNSWDLYFWNVVVSVSGTDMSIELKEHNPMVQCLQYYTAIPVNQIDAVLQNGKLINSVRVAGEEDSTRAVLTVNKDISSETQHLAKGRIPTIVGGTAKYYLDINPTGKKMSNDDYINITDALTLDAESTKTMDDLTIVLDDIKVYPYVNGVLDKQNPIEDFSYTVHYDVTEEKTLPVVKISDQLWEIQGWSPGDTIVAEVRQNEDYTSNAYLSVVNEDANGYMYGNGIQKEKFPDFSDSVSTVSMTIPDQLSSGGMYKPPSRLLIYDNGRYNNGESPYTISDVVSVKAVKTTPVILNMSVPDQQHVRIEYTYRVTGYDPKQSDGSSEGDSIYFTNTASFNEDNGDGWDSEIHSALNVQDAQASSEVVKYPKIYKVDVNNYSLNTLGASFKVAKYDPDHQKWIYASAVTIRTEDDKQIRQFTFPSWEDAADYLEKEIGGGHYAPDNAALLTFADTDDPSTDNDAENIHEFSLSNRSLYKFVEITAPEDYHAPDPDGSLEDNSEFVFFCAYNGYSGVYPDDTLDSDGRSKVNDLNAHGTMNIPNVTGISLSAQKTFTGQEEDLPDTASVTMKLYYSTNRSGINLKEVTADMLMDNTQQTMFTNPVTLTYDKDTQAEPTASWSDLPSGVNGIPVYYFVREESFTYDGKTYTFDPSDGKYRDGDGVESNFHPVYTRNGTNKNGTQILVNNSEGVLVKKSWVDLNGNTIDPPKEPDSDEPMAIRFEVYGIKGNYRVKLELSEDQSRLDSSNQYKLFLPTEVGITGVTGQSMTAALEYTAGKKYPLSYFDSFEIEEKLTEEQSNAILGKYANPQYTRMISDGTGILEIINTDMRLETVNVEAMKTWDDNGLSHSGEQIHVMLVQSTNPALRNEDLIQIAAGGSPEGKDYRTGAAMRSGSEAVLAFCGKSKTVDLGKEIQSISTPGSSGIQYSFSGTELTISGGNIAARAEVTVTYTDQTEQSLTISVIDPTAVLSNVNEWRTEWTELPAMNDEGASYYYYAVETDVPQGYDVIYSRTDESSIQHITVTNRLPTDLVISKKWYDTAGNEISSTESCLPEQITVYVYQKLETEETQSGTVTNPTDISLPSGDGDISTLTAGTPYGTYTIQKSEGYRLELQNLPKQNAAGINYVYYVREEGNHVEDNGSYRLTGSRFRYIKGVQYEGNGKTVLTNGEITINNTILTTDIHISKMWSDGNENHNDDTITVRIHRETTPDTEAAQQNPLTLTLSENEVTLVIGSGQSAALTASVPVRPDAEYDTDQLEVTLDSAKQAITVALKEGASPGDKNITFRTEDGQTAVLTVHIVDTPLLTLNLDKNTLVGGDAAPVVQSVMTLEGNDVKAEATYGSSDDSVISIDPQTGQMTVNGVGIAEITAEYDGKTATAVVTVTLPETFSITGENTVQQDQTIALSVTPDFGTFEWSSGDTSIATVDSNGVVTGVSPGTVTITATRSDGKKATMEVTVTELPSIITGTIPDKESGHTYDYVYDPATHKITVTATRENYAAIKFRLSDHPELKDLVPVRYEMTNYNASGQLQWHMSEFGISYSTNTRIENLKNTKAFSDMSDNDNIYIGYAGTHIIEITVQSEGGTFEPDETLNLSDVQNGNYYFDPNKVYLINTNAPITNITSGNTGNTSVNGNGQGWWAKVEYTENGTFFNVEVQRSGLNWPETITITTTEGSVTLGILSSNSVSANQNTARMTRFSSGALRLGSARTYATQLDETDINTPEPPPAEQNAKTLRSKPLRITSPESVSFWENGYIDITVSASDNWAVTLSDLPIYQFDEDGTVISCYYWAEEISGAEGYKASYVFTDADSSTNYSINAANSGEAAIQIRNTENQIPDSVDLPVTGGSGRSFTVTGLLLMISAGGYAMKKRRGWLDE